MKQRPNLPPGTNDRTPVHRRQRPLPLSPRDKVSLFLRRHLHIPVLRPDGETLGKAALCGGLILFFALLQTTVFARFRPFGAIPDLMLPLVIAIAMTEGEKWGAVCGIIAAFIIESIGADTISLMPLLYMPAGYFCPIITRLYLTDTVPVRLIYTALSGVGRAVLSLLRPAMRAQQFDLTVLFAEVVLPAYASTFLMAIPVHVLVRLAFHPFHKSRSERIGTL